MENLEVQPFLYSIDAVCEALMISRTSFYRLVRSGKLPLLKIGNRSFVAAEALQRFVDGLRADGEVATK
ncbi:MAG: helix-turn-helix domain-containing protein [Acidothermus cellulolyticus]|nr:helix-turn-helix domain-containing protein [Acidothermus cellulolyticus]